MKYDKLKDSGERESFENGAIRDTSINKGRFDLIPPHSLKRLAIHYELGSKKYSDNNYLKGMPTKRCLESALRHINDYRMGLDDEDNLSAAIWNLIAVIETEYLISLGILPKHLDDGKFYDQVSDMIKKIKEENGGNNVDS